MATRQKASALQQTNLVSDVASVLPFGAGSTSSTSYVDIPGSGNTITMSFTKQRADTKLIISGSLGFYMSSIGGVILGVSVGGTDYEMGRRYKNETTAANISGHAKVTGVAAGAVTVKLRIKLSAGTLQLDSAHGGSMLVQESF